MGNEITERLLPSLRRRLKALDFAIPERKAWPIQDEEQALIAIQYMRMGRGDPSEYGRIKKMIALRYSDSAKVMNALQDLTDDDIEDDSIDDTDSTDDATESIMSNGMFLLESLMSDLEEKYDGPKVTYWRTTKNGRHIGFRGKPGKGWPVVGFGGVVDAMQAKIREKGRADREGSRAEKRAAKDAQDAMAQALPSDPEPNPIDIGEPEAPKESKSKSAKASAPKHTKADADRVEKELGKWGRTPDGQRTAAANIKKSAKGDATKIAGALAYANANRLSTLSKSLKEGLGESLGIDFSRWTIEECLELPFF